MRSAPIKLATLAPLSAAVLTLTLMLTPTAAAADEPVYGFSDSPSEPADLARWNPNIHPAPWFETWDYWMWGDDGTFVFVQFVTSSFGFGIERKASGRLIIVEPTARNRGALVPGVALGDRGWEWEAGDWRWSETPLELTFADCTIRGDGQTFEVRMRGRDRLATLEVTLELTEPPIRPGDGRLEYGWERRAFYDMEALPRFSFEGRYLSKERRDDPDEWTPIRGVGYAEHTLTNAQPNQVADAFHGFRALRPDGLSIVIDTVVVPPSHGARTIGWGAVALDGQRIFESVDVRLSTSATQRFDDGSTPYMVPVAYEAEAVSGDDWVRVRFYDADIVSAESPFARLSSFLKRVLGAMMSPYDFESAGQYEAWIHIGGHTAYVSGTGWSSSSFTR